MYSADLEFFTHFVEEHREDLPTLIWKDTPPQHFQYERGYFWWVTMPSACHLSWPLHPYAARFLAVAFFLT